MSPVNLKPTRIRIGEKVMMKPTINENRRQYFTGNLPGTIVYINRPHRFYTVEFKFKYGSFRESYKFFEKGDLICQKQ